MKKWTNVYNAAEVVLSFDNPGDALFMYPRKVLVGNGQTECFIDLPSCHIKTLRELRAHKKMAAANLDPALTVARLHGIVWDGNRDHISGLLMRYIDNHGPCQDTLMDRIRGEGAPAHLRKRWATQIDTAVAALHGGGVVWGDVEPHKVLVDRDDNAWVTGFGGRYTSYRGVGGCGPDADGGGEPLGRGEGQGVHL